MNPHTGEIHHGTPGVIRALERDAGTPFHPLNEREHAELRGQPLAERKNWMRNKPCPCKSGKKFKKCCWSKYA